MSTGKRLGISATLLGLALSCGCLVGGNSTVKRDGNYVAESTLDQIEPGKTDKAWVLATLGDPTEKKQLDPGHELWKYAYKETKEGDGYVFLIFAGSGKTITGGNVFVELKDNVVTKSWRG